MHAHGQLYRRRAGPLPTRVAVAWCSSPRTCGVGYLWLQAVVPYGCRRVVRVSKVAALHNPVPKSVRKVGGMGGAACEKIEGALPSQY